MHAGSSTGSLAGRLFCIVPALALSVASCGESGGHTGADTGIDQAPGDTVVAEDGVPDIVGPDATEDTPGADTVSDTWTEPDAVIPADCPVAWDLGAGNHTVPISHDGMDRSYILHVPASYDPGTRTPLIMNIHGLQMTATMQVTFTGMNAASDAHGFVVAYPDGYARSWNAGTCCGDAASEGLDDVGFIRAVVVDIRTRLCIDASRIYATGMSNGGHMAHRLACEANDVFAAFAPVAGGMTYLGCSPGRAVPIIGYHGVDDYIVFYSLGETAMNGWVARNGCTADPVRTGYGEFSYCDAWETCSDGVFTVLCTLDPMGHCWPNGSSLMCSVGLGEWNGDIDANEHMWQFFSRYTLP